MAYTEKTIYIGGKADEYTVTAKHFLWVKEVTFPLEGRYMTKEAATRKVAEMEASWAGMGLGLEGCEMCITTYKYQIDPDLPKDPAPDYNDPGTIVTIGEPEKEENPEPEPSEPSPTEKPREGTLYEI
ncbi:hypothetical protein COE80_19300 [Bacillus pseudomycoides]|uniref:hypothetical protein n=1 Tax=Bacillus pseudomycoides TaxID=64104 RepID=UPI000BFD806E|nr:hypothetical protein [Bacillus pseudomycoides]PHB23061.1 hypothetical protein COE80_19300 [Bacillus pseudomycoides]PHE37591.1 hypothetical protein COF51_16265 [Bacillus pseudomycoides]